MLTLVHAQSIRHFYRKDRRLSAPAWPRWAGTALLLAAALLYWLTLDNGLRPGELEGGDLITHQYAQVQARPGNAPGYPLFTMGGWLWFHGLRTAAHWLGITPNPISLLSSYSTLWALLSLWLLYRILLHCTRSPRRPAGDWPLAWLLCAFYAVTYFFWYYATTSEQYTSAIAHTLAILYVYLLWRDNSQFTIHHSPFTILLLLSFLSGLSLAHMITVALIVPPLLAALLWQEPQLLRRPGLILGAVLAAALPLLSYVYVYMRGAAHPEWWGVGDWVTAQDWFWSFVGTAQGQDELSWGLAPGAAFFANGFPELIWQELSIPLLAVGLLGIGFLEKRLRLVVGGTLALYALLCWVDRFGNWFQVILPAYPLLLVGVAAAADKMRQGEWRLEIGDWGLGKKRRNDSDPNTEYAIRNPQSAIRWGVWALLVMLILWRTLASLPAADSRDRPGDTALDRPALLLDQPLPEDAALFAAKDDALGLDYLMQIGGIRPGLRVVDKSAANERLAEGKRLLVTADAAALLLGELTVAPPQAHGWSADWVELLPAGATQTRQPVVVLDKLLGDGIVLRGFTVADTAGADAAGAGGNGLDVLLFWSVMNGFTPANWSISLRAAGDGAAAQQDSPGPVLGLRPFASLEAGQTIVDAYRLDAQADTDELLLILYRAKEGGFENLVEETLWVGDSE